MILDSYTEQLLQKYFEILSQKKYNYRNYFINIKKLKLINIAIKNEQFSSIL